MIAVLTVALATFGVATATAQDGVDDPDQVAEGQVVFEANCTFCHGIDGKGTDQGRPLTDIASQEPDRSVHVNSVTNGKGPVMPAWGDELTDEEIDQVVSYVRLTFVSQAEPDVEPELAVTGSETAWLVFGGIALVMAGIVVTARSRNEGTSS